MKGQFGTPARFSEQEYNQQFKGNYPRAAQTLQELALVEEVINHDGTKDILIHLEKIQSDGLSAQQKNSLQGAAYRELTSRQRMNRGGGRKNTLFICVGICLLAGILTYTVGGSRLLIVCEQIGICRRPTPSPTASPIVKHFSAPTVAPTETPAPEPTVVPTETPALTPTVAPTETPDPTVTPIQQQPHLSKIEIRDAQGFYLHLGSDGKYHVKPGGTLTIAVTVENPSNLKYAIEYDPKKRIRSGKYIAPAENGYSEKITIKLLTTTLADTKTIELKVIE